MTVNYHNLNLILEEIKGYDLANLLIVTKNQSLNDIHELISKGFKLFGENRVQEAKKKYQALCETKKINLHLIGPLQTNKVKDALFLFDTIQSIDREKLVDEISKFIIKDIPIKTKSFYIQINIGAEVQKSGVEKSQCINFYKYAIDKKLNIEGLMCIPPNTTDVNEYFLEMNEIRRKINPNLKLSMGMSNDYKLAIKFKSNMVRIGSLIFN